MRSTFVELSVLERIPRRMFSRLLVIAYSVKKRMIQPERTVMPKITSAAKLIHVTCSFGRPVVLIMNFCM